jgi:hypothetical protein
MSLRTAVTDMVDALTGAGISAAADPQELNLPAVWVQLSTVAENLLSGDITVTLKLNLIAGDAGTLAALDTLSDLYQQVIGVVTPNTDTDTTTVTVQLPDNPTSPMPALQLTVATPETLT